MIWWLAQNTAAAGLLACLVAAACRLGRFGPAVRHVLWLLVLVKLLTPPLIAWPWAVPDPFTVETTAMADETAPDLEVTAVAVDAHDAALGMLEQAVLDLSAEKAGLELLAAGGVPEDVASSEPQELSPRTSSLPPRTSSRAWLGPCLLYAWLAGTGIMVLVQWRRIASFRCRLAHGYPGPSWLVRLVRSLGGRLGVALPRPVVVPGSGSPLVWSLGRPQLVWPADLLDRLPAESRRSVVAHELAHLKRRDHWVGWLLLVAECLWWWNPLFWWVRRQVRHHAELACDAWVVSTLPDDRRAYAEALIDVSQWISTAALPVPALGMGQGPRQAFTERLTMIMRDATPCRVPRFGLLAVGVLALLVIPGWSLAQKANEQKIELKKVIIDPASDSERAVIVLTDEPEGKDAIKVLGRLVFDNEEQQAGGAQRTKTAQDGRDKKLEEMEAKLQALLKEIRALRGAPATTTFTVPVETRQRMIAVPQTPVTVEVQTIPKTEVYTNVIRKPVTVEVQTAPKTEVKAHVYRVPEKNVELQVETVPGVRSRTSTTATQVQTVTAHSPEVMAAIKKAIAALQAAGKKAEAEELMKALESMHRIEIRTAPQSSAPATPAKGAVTATLAQPATTAPSPVREYRTALASYYRALTPAAGELLLSRMTYKLENKAKAEALGRFLKDNVKASVLDVKVEGEGEALTITTTPETQKAIGQLMSLIKGGKTGASVPEMKPLGDFVERRILADFLENGSKLESKPKATENKAEPRQ